MYQNKCTKITKVLPRIMPIHEYRYLQCKVQTTINSLSTNDLLCVVVEHAPHTMIVLQALRSSQIYPISSFNLLF